MEVLIYSFKTQSCSSKVNTRTKLQMTLNLFALYNTTMTNIL